MRYKNGLTFKSSFRLVVNIMVFMAACAIPFLVMRKTGLIGENIMFTLSYITGTVLCILVIFKLKRGELSGFATRHLSWQVYPLLILLTLCLIMAEDPVAHFRLIPDWLEATFMDMSKNKLLFFVITGVVAPVLEEIIFRGYILKGLLHKYPKWRAVFYTALLFAIIHMNPAQSFGAFFLGMLAGWAYVRFKNILAPIVIHAANNIFCWFMIISERLENKSSVYEFFPSGGSYAAAVVISCVLLGSGIYLLQQERIFKSL